MTVASKAALLPALAAAALLTVPSAAHAQRKKAAGKPAPACGIDYLPLVEGAQWTYEPFSSPLPISEEDQAQLTKWAFYSPAPPAKIVIKVESIATEGDATVVTLDENADGASRKTTISCTKNGLSIDPQSFFFAVEPGGALLMELSDVKQTGELPGSKGWKKTDKITVTVTAKLARTSTEGTGAELTGGMVELERNSYTGGLESVATPTGRHDKSQRVEFELLGRVAVEPKMDKPIDLPLRWRGYMWFKNGVGLVQARNRIGQWFQLTEHNLK